MLQSQSPLELKVPPVAQALLLAATMWLLATALPAFVFDLPARLLLCAMLVVAGALVGLAGVTSFARAKTTVDPLHPDAASSLVIAGIYRWSRNPMYLGLLLALAGWAMYLENVMAFALLPVFVIYMNRYQIRPEERALQQSFGPEYLAYLNSVRRWI